MAKKEEENDIHLEDASDSLLEEALNKAADTVCKECMQIQRKENVLIVTDPHTSTIGQALYEAAARISDRVLLVMMPSTHRHGDEPPAPVSDLMRKQDVVLAPTRYSLTHTRARMQACREGTRIATMPGITMKMFTEGGMTTDFNAMQSAIAQLGKSLKRQRKVEVKTENGTSVKFEISGRWELGDNGICNRPGQVTNLPAGKILAMPKEGTMDGKIVIDASDNVQGIITRKNVLGCEDSVTVTLDDGKQVAFFGHKLNCIGKTGPLSRDPTKGPSADSLPDPQRSAEGGATDSEGGATPEGGATASEKTVAKKRVTKKKIIN